MSGIPFIIGESEEEGKMKSVRAWAHLGIIPEITRYSNCFPRKIAYNSKSSLRKYCIVNYLYVCWEHRYLKLHFKKGKVSEISQLFISGLMT